MVLTNVTNLEFLLGKGLVLAPHSWVEIPDEIYLHEDYVRRMVNLLVAANSATIEGAPDWWPIQDADGRIQITLQSLLGTTGPIGATGTSGTAGAQGATGAKGPTGDPGPTGPSGLQGAAGPEGPGLGWYWRRKLVDEPVVLSTLLQDDDLLQFPSALADGWVFEGYLIYEAHGTGDLKVTVAGPAGMTGHWSFHPQGSAGGNSQMSDSIALGVGQVMPGAGAGISQIALVKGFILTPAAGPVKIQWAQNSSHAVPTIMKAGSYFFALRVEHA